MNKVTIDLSPFPNGVGKVLQYQPFDLKTKIELPLKTIIRIYGLVGAGKGTLANLLCKNIRLTNLETSNILRSGTWIYEKLSLEFNNKNTDLVFGQIDLKLNDSALEFFWNGVKLTSKELRSEVVDQKVSMYSGDPYYRSKYYERINFMLDNLVSTPVILDGRGSNTPYLNQAEKSGFQVVRIFLWVNPVTSYQRFLTRKNIVETKQNKTKLSQEFQTNVVDRDLKDFNNIVANNLGTISYDTGIIDTSELTPTQILQTSLGFIESQLKNN